MRAVIKHWETDVIDGSLPLLSVR